MNGTNSRISILIVAAVGGMLLSSFFLQNFALLMIAISLIIIVYTLTTNYLRQFSIILASLVFALGIADFLAGFFVSKKHEAYFDISSSYSTTYKKKTDIGSQASEGKHSSRKISKIGEVIYDVNYTIGPDGFRLTDQSQQKTERINFFGCSFTFGEGLNDSETLPYYFAQHSDSFKVKNFGFHGYGVHQAVAIMQSDRDTAGKLNFLLTVPWHAQRSACKPTWTAGSPRYSLINNDPHLVGKCRDGLTKESNFLKKVLQNSNIYELVSKAIKVEAVSDQDFNLYLALVNKIYEISRNKGQEFVIGFIKADEKFFDGTTHTNQTIFEALRQRSDRIIDLTLAESAESLERKYLIHALDKHPSAVANEERSKRLVEFIGR